MRASLGDDVGENKLKEDRANTARRTPKGPPRGGQSFARWIFDVEERPSITRNVDMAIFALACVMMVLLHVTLYSYSGAFWRDEVSTIFAATSPDLGTLWTRLANDSAPVVYFGALRLWIEAGLGGNDESLRLFGTVISWGIVASLCISCWMFTSRAPLLAMSLVAFNSAVFYYCSSLRAYGLAVLFIMPCCTAFWRVSVRPSVWNVLASLALALLSCHTSYTNSYLLLAIGLAGAGVCAACRLWKRSVLILAICFATALSLLVYLPLIFNFRGAIQISQSEVSVSTIGNVLTKALSVDHPWLLSIWILLAVSAVVCIVVQVVRRWKSFGTTPSLSLYVAILTVVAATVGMGFFITNAMMVYAWHFTPFIALAGMMMELAFQSERHKLWAWLARTMIACLAISISLPILAGASQMRRTNIDCAAAKLTEMAGPNDLILVAPAWLVPTFWYYYHGTVEWNSVPLIPPEMIRSLNGNSALKQSMMTPDALVPTIEKMRSTLTAGNKVWLVGRVTFPEKDAVPVLLPPAPHSPFGWRLSTYVESWLLQVGYFVRWHADRVGEVKLDIDQRISQLEKCTVVVVEGWHESPKGVPPLPSQPEASLVTP
jgi:hypothetical protein